MGARLPAWPSPHRAHHATAPTPLSFAAATDEATDLNTFVFTLKAEGAPPAVVSGLASLEGEGDVASPYTNVYARELMWSPKGAQEERLSRPAAVVNGDILLAKLAPGQVIDLEAHAVKGIGKDHAKFSPVATASYKLHTSIELSKAQPFVGEEAVKLAKVCPMGVFDIEDIGAKKGGAWTAWLARACLRPNSQSSCALHPSPS